MPIEVNDENFEKEVLEKSKEKPVIVDFWADWCMPCLILGPVLEKVEKEYEDRIVLAKVNVDKNPAITQKYKIMSIPSIKFFKDGEVIDEFIGAIPEEEFKNWIDKNLKKI